MEKSGEELEMDFAVDIATVPYRIPNRPPPELIFGEYHHPIGETGGILFSPVCAPKAVSPISRQTLLVLLSCNCLV